jgi:hypothetical protein
VNGVDEDDGAFDEDFGVVAVANPMARRGGAGAMQSFRAGGAAGPGRVSVRGASARRSVAVPAPEARDNVVTPPLPEE